MPDFITWTAFVVSAIVLFLMWMSGISTDAPYTFGGFFVVGVLMTIFEVLKRAMPNPYRKTVYRVNWSRYAVWLMQHPEKKTPGIQPYVKVILIKALPGCLVQPNGKLVLGGDVAGEIIAAEANTLQEVMIPAKALSPVNNLEAWLYHRRAQRAAQEAS